MPDNTESLSLELKVENVGLGTLPMDKIGEIMRRLADLAESKKHVHLEAVTDGCVSFAWRVEAAAVANVSTRLSEAGQLDGGSARAAWQDLNDVLTDIGSRAELSNKTEGKVILAFPGALAADGALPPFWQTGSLRGRFISLRLTNEGYKGTVTNASGREIFEVNEALAVELKAVLFGHVEISGRARWQRNADGQWRLLKFQASGHRVLGSDGLATLRSRLLAAGGFGPADSDQVRQELDAVR